MFPTSVVVETTEPEDNGVSLVESNSGGDYMAKNIRVGAINLKYSLSILESFFSNKNVGDDFPNFFLIL